jgi:hypothetical protein
MPSVYTGSAVFYFCPHSHNYGTCVCSSFASAASWQAAFEGYALKIGTKSYRKMRFTGMQAHSLPQKSVLSALVSTTRSCPAGYWPEGMNFPFMAAK